MTKSGPKRKYAIQSRRIYAGFSTADEYADYSGRNRSTYKSYEQEKASPPIPVVISLCHDFHCTMEALLNQEELLKYLEPSSRDDSLVARVSRAFMHANDGGKQAFLTLAKILESEDEEVKSSVLLELGSLINSSLAQKRGDRRDSGFPATAV